MSNICALVCENPRMPAQLPGPPVDRFVCEPCGVDIEVWDAAHLPVVAALHRAVCHPFDPDPTVEDE